MGMNTVNNIARLQQSYGGVIRSGSLTHSRILYSCIVTLIYQTTNQLVHVAPHLPPAGQCRQIRCSDFTFFYVIFTVKSSTEFDKRTIVWLICNGSSSKKIWMYGFSDNTVRISEFQNGEHCGRNRQTVERGRGQEEKYDPDGTFSWKCGYLDR